LRQTLIVRSVSDLSAQSGRAAGVQVRVLGPEWTGPTATELRRLFPGRRLTTSRRERLAQGGRVVAACAGRMVALAAYERLADELRVYEFGLDPHAPCPTSDIVSTLLDALEVACLAGGECRLVLHPRAEVAESVLRSRGYTVLPGGSAGPWFEKRFPS
jgi:hypothetical protein